MFVTLNCAFLQVIEEDKIQHKTLTATFCLMTLNFSCAAASSALA
jgi:hypothetical protein